MVRWVDVSFWFLEYWFQKGAIEVDYLHTDPHTGYELQSSWFLLVRVDIGL